MELINCSCISGLLPHVHSNPHPASRSSHCLGTVGEVSNNLAIEQMILLDVTSYIPVQNHVQSKS